MSPRPLHILQVTAPAPHGGAESVVLGLAEGLRERGHRVTVSAAVDRAGEHPFLSTLAAREVPTLIHRAGYGREILDLRAFIRREQVDALHSHGYRSDVLTLLARSGRPVMATVHGFTGGDAKGRLYEQVQLRALRFFDVVVPVSAPLQVLLVRHGVRPERLHLIPNAYAPMTAPQSRDDARRHLGLSSTAPVIGWVGRFSREKGADVALDALARLPDPWTAVMIGAGPELAALQTRSAALGLVERVRWTGPIPHAAALFPAFDLFLLSSRTEGTPIVLLEAMAARVPIVATAVGGVPDLMGGDGGAVLAPPEDPVALAAGIRQVLDDPARAAVRAETAWDRLQRVYDRTPWVAQYEAVYASLVGRA